MAVASSTPLCQSWILAHLPLSRAYDKESNTKALTRSSGMPRYHATFSKDYRVSVAQEC